MTLNFMRWRLIYFMISLVVIVPGLVSLARFGLRPSIDFTGGSLLEIKGENLSLETNQIKEKLAPIYELSQTQQSGPNQYILRGKPLSNEQKNQVIAALETQTGQIQALRFESVGPVLGRELLINTLTAASVAALLIMAYVWKQFHELRYGVSAILAMLHDTLVLLGTFSLLGVFMGVEVDVLFVTAVMTTLSFSVHDTIVVYDRIREIRRKHSTLPFSDVINLSILQTLSRSIINSMTIIIMLLALVLLGGESIRWFAVALLVGAVTGTYSSTFTAAPLLLLWNNWSKRKK